MFDRTAWLYDAFYDALGKDYRAEAHAIVEQVRAVAPRAATLLDVACGTGRHIQHLRDAFDCTGVDINGNLLSIAKQRCPRVTFVQADMTKFDLSQRFDVVVCLFSSIGYARTTEGMHAAVAAMARHLTQSGVLVVEPSFAPEEWQPGRVHAVFIDQADLKATRMSVSDRVGDVGILDFHYLVGSGGAVEYLQERHELGLFSRDDYAEAFAAAGLDVHVDEHGLTGRGLLTGTRHAD